MEMSGWVGEEGRVKRGCRLWQTSRLGIPFVNLAEEYCVGK